jgi:protein-L-isoaspartate(D-aspartate) O-methyltransferase
MATLRGGGRGTSGIGMTSDRTRARMIERLRADGIRDEVVLSAMNAIPRHIFVDEALAIRAYDDSPLPIGSGQTISQPWVVARMTELARNGREIDGVLEIGTGCGYQTALLARLARSVISIERLQPLHQMARRHLDALGVPGVRLVHGDGRLGHPPNAPYDSIVAAAGGEAVPEAWLAQLAPGGRLVAPTAMPGLAGQALVIVDRTPDGFVRQIGESVSFVPLKSGIG